MEIGAHVWLRSKTSQWGWVPAIISNKIPIVNSAGVAMVRLLLRDDPLAAYEQAFTSYSSNSPPPSDVSLNESDFSMALGPSSSVWQTRENFGSPKRKSNEDDENGPFEVTMDVDPEQLKKADHEDIKLRNVSSKGSTMGGLNTSLDSSIDSTPKSAADVDDLITLTHLHEPAILHALRVRYDRDIIYTSTGPILIAVNPFKSMPSYSEDTMEQYRIQGEMASAALLSGKRMKNKLPPHVYQSADNAYRAMMRGLENAASALRRGNRGSAMNKCLEDCSQSILVSGESGAGKTVTTKIALNYLAVLSKKQSELTASGSNRRMGVEDLEDMEEEVTIEQQVLQSNPILEAFGNARTIRNDNSSRFGKYIDVHFTSKGKLAGAAIETYLLEKVRLIHPTMGERNYHVFYQFLASATDQERDQFFLGDMMMEDFMLLSQSDTFDRRDGVSDETCHLEMLDAMITIGFSAEMIQSLMRLVVSILFLGNITFTSTNHGESCDLDMNDASLAAASLLGVTFEGLASSLTTRNIRAGLERMTKPLTVDQSAKAKEALIKATYGAAFDFIVDAINESIKDEETSGLGDGDRSTSSRSVSSRSVSSRSSRSRHNGPVAFIGVLDIFGFESFAVNSFEQICINYTNEALQQQFNKYVFKLEQQEYEKEGIMWKFISFPDNQDVLDLIDKKHVGILAVLDEQCIVPQSTDQKFTRYLYAKCESHARFLASSTQRVNHKFSVVHYAGNVEYTTKNWLEKNKDELSGGIADLLRSSEFDLIPRLQRYFRTEERNGGRRGSIVTKSVGAQFACQLRTLRDRIDTTVPHYIRCLKPNDNLVPFCFEPKNIVEQLRCGGVLEAVRVSRAGYPTRYSHDIFFTRYSIVLGATKSRKDEKPSRGQLEQLVGKIAYKVWEADTLMIQSTLEAERAKEALSSKKFSTVTSPVNGHAPSVKHTPPRRNLAVTSSATPARKKTPGTPSAVSNTLRERQLVADQSGIRRPETKEEFYALDLASRCALAGLQLGKTKIFLRRQAFDRIEAILSQVFFQAATRIQSKIRGRQGRFLFIRMKKSVVLVQSFTRMLLATRLSLLMMYEKASIKIQSVWRMAQSKYTVWKCYQQLTHAVNIIQRAYRNKKEFELSKHELEHRRDARVRDIQARETRERESRERESRELEIRTREAREREARKKEEREDREKEERARKIRETKEREELACKARETEAREELARKARERASREQEIREREALEREAQEREERVERARKSTEHNSATLIQAIVRGKMARRRFSGKVENLEHDAQVENYLPPNPPNFERVQMANTESKIQYGESDYDSEASLKHELYLKFQEENWAMVESILDNNPDLAEEEEPSSGELPLHIISRHSGAWTLLIDMILLLYPKALIHRDRMGALPIHHAAAHDSIAALEIVYSAYKEGINDVDFRGRLPIHVAAEFDAVEAVKFLLEKSPEGSYTMVHRPPSDSGGGLPLHVACRSFASIGVITALLAENFASAKRADENGDLPLHLILRCGPDVDQVVVKTLLTCFSAAVSRTDMNGDLPLAIALKNQCKAPVINTLLLQFPDSAGILDGSGQSPLFLAFQHDADDRTILGLLNHAPELATSKDKLTGLIPIQVATEREHSHFIVHNLLKRDMPIDLKEKVRAQLLPHNYSWNHIVTNTNDTYHQVVTKLLQQCTQPQVLALAHVEGSDGKIALASATPVCKHELRVMLRLFNTLEVVNQRPAYTNPISDTQIFYALRYEPPAHQVPGAFTVLHEEKRDEALDQLEDMDDNSVISGVSSRSMRSNVSTRSQQSIDEKLRMIRKEKGQQVIAKLTSRSDVVERELSVRKEYRLSRHYIPAIISVHHTVQHAAYSEAMAEPGYCITMEGADTTAENMMLDLRKAGQSFSPKALKRIGVSLLHMHEHGLIHGDFGTHNIGKFKSRWKLLGVGGAVPIGDFTDPNRGFYHPPEAIEMGNKRASVAKKSPAVSVISIKAQCVYDIWAYGVVVYESLAGTPLPPYACRGKRAMCEEDIWKISQWDDHALKKALRNIGVENNLARDLLKKLLHPEPNLRIKSMREALEHSFFGSTDDANKQTHKNPVRNHNGRVSTHDSKSLRSSSTDSRAFKISAPSDSHIPATSKLLRQPGARIRARKSRASTSAAASTLRSKQSNGSGITSTSGLNTQITAPKVLPSKSDAAKGKNNEENIANGVEVNKYGSTTRQKGKDDSKKSRSFSGLRNSLRSRRKQDKQMSTSLLS